MPAYFGRFAPEFPQIKLTIIAAAMRQTTLTLPEILLSRRNMPKKAVFFLNRCAWCSSFQSLPSSFTSLTPRGELPLNASTVTATDFTIFLKYSEGVEKCIPWSENITQQIDLAFNIFFMVYFFIRVSTTKVR